MKRFLLLSFFLLAFAAAFSQEDQKELLKEYRATAEKINDLVHTKLDAKFDYSKSQLNGKVWITLKPHFYATDSLALDAKGMDVKSVSMVKGNKNSPLKFQYDGMILNVRLDKSYKGGEQYTVYIDYTAKPNEYTGKGSAAITDAKGLYFINPLGKEKDKPTQIWTQGETEATSVWLPTIDKPNQKTTEEIYMTVPSKYVTLSNGKLMSQKNNSDGTRTDYWKMDEPNAPYLFFMGVGDYAVIKDKYKNKEVNYYVEKKYAPVARKIFGNTPQMIALFSRLTGVDYPWVKYSQIVGRDYVSGAMENTTATLHQESAQQDARELTDGNRWEEVIAHELFHQWFGDYVTTESWSNITLNESFATLGSQLWNEYGHSKDAAYAERYGSLQGYYNGKNENKDLVRFHYGNKEDVFDAVSYNKGGGILQMLRNYVGDSAFFKSLNLYLNTNKYKSAEAQQLRLAFEEVTGKDLNWFFNQWYYGSGHPKFNITYSYDDAAKQARMIVEQTQSDSNLFTLPVNVDVWNGNKPARHAIWINDKVDTFYFPAASKPELVNFDADKILVAQKTENKSLNDFLFQYKNAGNYIDRKEAIDAAIKKQDDAAAAQILLLGIKDPFAPLRSYTIGKLDFSNDQIKKATEAQVFDIAQNDKNRPVKAAAIAKLGELKEIKYKNLFQSALSDSSYSVAGSSLEALAKVDSTAAFAEAKRLSAQPSKGRLTSAITRVLIRFGDESSADIILKNFEDLPLEQAKFEAIRPLTDFLNKINAAAPFKRGVDDLLNLVNDVPESFRGQVANFIEGQLRSVQKNKTASGQTELANYIESKLSKKGF
jgi:aminopeptidase N